MAIKNRHLKNQQIRFDGEDDYIDCTFTDCEMVYGGGSTGSFTRCRFKGTRFTFDGCAASTIAFMKQLYSIGGADVMERTFEDIRKSASNSPLRLNTSTDIIH